MVCSHCLYGSHTSHAVGLFFFFKQKTAYEMRISDWSSDVCSSDLLDRLVIEDAPVAQQAVVAVAVVGVERDIADDADVGQRVLHRADGAAHQVARIDRLARVRRLQFLRGIGEQRDRADALLAGGADGIDQAVEAESVDARHRGDRLPAVAVVHEDRPDQVVSAQPVLRDQAANPAGAAVAPQPNLREGAEAALPLSRGPFGGLLRRRAPQRRCALSDRFAHLPFRSASRWGRLRLAAAEFRRGPVGQQGRSRAACRPGPLAYSAAAAPRAAVRAGARSASMSSMCSRPTDNRTELSVTPVASCCSGVSWECVVEAGWMARLRASPRLATW